MAKPTPGKVPPAIAFLVRMRERNDAYAGAAFLNDDQLAELNSIVDSVVADGSTPQLLRRARVLLAAIYERDKRMPFLDEDDREHNFTERSELSRLIGRQPGSAPDLPAVRYTPTEESNPQLPARLPTAEPSSPYLRIDHPPAELVRLERSPFPLMRPRQPPWLRHDFAGMDVHTVRPNRGPALVAWGLGLQVIATTILTMVNPETADSAVTVFVVASVFALPVVLRSWLTQSWISSPRAIAMTLPWMCAMLAVPITGNAISNGDHIGAIAVIGFIMAGLASRAMMPRTPPWRV